MVKYHSSHLDWSASEKIVPSGHSVQDDPASAVELRRILREHLVKVKGRKTLEEADAKAATPVWQANPEKALMQGTVSPCPCKASFPSPLLLFLLITAAIFQSNGHASAILFPGSCMSRL